MAAEKYWGDAEVTLPSSATGKKLAPRPQPLPAEQEEFMPEKLTTAWLEAQLPRATWQENKSVLTPSMIKLTSELARKGLSKRAIMARVGLSVQTWGNWEKKAALGEQPYALWYQCVMYSLSGIEEELLATVKRHTVTEWKAAQWLLKTVNRDEYEDVKPGATTVNISGDTENKVTINQLDHNEALAIYRLMNEVKALPTAADVVDAEVVEDTDAD